MKNLVYFILLAVLISACEKTVTIDVPRKDPKLVIYGWIEKDKLITLSVGKSRYILDGSINGNQQELYTVKDAQVVVFENGIPIDTLVYQPTGYNYKSIHNKTIRGGYTYSVKVKAPGFADVESVSIVPSQSDITEVTRVRNARVNTIGDEQDEVTIRLNDPAGEQNFYMIQVYGTSYGYSDGSPIYCVSTTDKDIELIGDNADPLNSDNCFDGSNLLMRDVNFNGGQKLIRLFVNSNELQEYVEPSSGRKYRPYLKVHRITEDYFRYIKSYSAYYNATDNPFAEPVNVYSNVKNGYGTFSVHTMAVDTLR
jgi:Domain of unknown function (DUF4249)